MKRKLLIILGIFIILLVFFNVLRYTLDIFRSNNSGKQFIKAREFIATNKIYFDSVSAMLQSSPTIYTMVKRTSLFTKNYHYEIKLEQDKHIELMPESDLDNIAMFKYVNNLGIKLDSNLLHKITTLKSFMVNFNLLCINNSNNYIDYVLDNDSHIIFVSTTKNLYPLERGNEVVVKALSEHYYYYFHYMSGFGY